MPPEQMKQIATEQAFTAYVKQRCTPIFPACSLFSSPALSSISGRHACTQLASGLCEMHAPLSQADDSRTPEITETLRAVFGLADIAQKEQLTIEQEDVEQDTVPKGYWGGSEYTGSVRNVNI